MTSDPAPRQDAPANDCRKSPQEPLCDFAEGFIRRKARQLVGTAGFNDSDEEELAQELRLKLLERLPKFDPSQAHLFVFIVTVVERAAASLVKHARAEKRDRRRATSLNTPLSRGTRDEHELGDSVSQSELDARRRSWPRTDLEKVQLALDVEDVLRSLPGPLRELCHLLMWLTPTEIAAETGIPRTTVLHRMRRIRQRFEDVGLRDYLGK